MNTSYKKKIYWLILIVFIVKLICASLLELGNDEVYYWTYALQPDWNHFDHPAGVGWLIRFSTINLVWVNDVSLRLGALIGAALSTWFIFKTGEIVANEKTGWYAALIYNCSIYTGFIAGFFILPDSPQMPFWTAALYVMSLLILKNEEQKLGSWIGLGLLIGLASLCKVHGLYLWVGFGLFIVCCKINWLSNWKLYIGVAVTIVCLIPIVYWNVMNDFITYRYHSDRVTHTKMQWDNFVREFGGEVAYQNPIIFILAMVAVIMLLKKQIHFNSKNTSVWLLCMSLPMIFIFWGVSFFNPTLPHWSGPGFIPLYIIAAVYLEKKSLQVLPNWIKLAGIFTLLLLIIGIGLIRFAPVNFGSQDKQNFGEYCPTLDMSGWEDFSNSFDHLMKDDIANRKMKNQSPIVINKWFPGGHLELYTSRKTGLSVIGIGRLEDIHKFAWLNKTRIQLTLGDDAYAIVPSNLPLDVYEAYGTYFTTIEKPVVINQNRNGGVVRFFYIYRMKNCKKLPVNTSFFEGDKAE